MSSKVLILGLVLALGACGANKVDRAITGAAIGATAGAAGAAVSDNDIGPAAIVGGLVGGAVGAATDSGDFDLGEPIYKRRF